VVSEGGWRRGAGRRRVDPVGERKKKMSFSLVGPAWHPDTEPVSRTGLQWADVVERAAGLRLDKLPSSIFSVLFSFLFSVLLFFEF
jgi:hypothetical protein